MSRYRNSIANLPRDSWDPIINGAWKIAQEKRVGRATPSGSMDVGMPNADEREPLVEAKEVVVNDKIDWETCE